MMARHAFHVEGVVELVNLFFGPRVLPGSWCDQVPIAGSVGYGQLPRREKGRRIVTFRVVSF